MDKEFPLEYTRRKGIVFDVSKAAKEGREIGLEDVGLAAGPSAGTDASASLESSVGADASASVELAAGAAVSAGAGLSASAGTAAGGTQSRLSGKECS